MWRTPLQFTADQMQRGVFESHDLASRHLIEALLRIFVDIEFTGESMEFENKFRTFSHMINALTSTMTCTHVHTCTLLTLKLTNSLTRMCTEYRIPMYEVLEFLWRLPQYRASIEALAAKVRLSVRPSVCARV